MAKNLAKILAILTISSIPLNISQERIEKKDYSIVLENPSLKVNREKYNELVTEINDKFSTLDTMEKFFLERLKEKDIDSGIKERYSKALEEIEQKRIKYKKEKDSLYKIYHPR